MFFNSIKEINRLISKGMSNIYYWEKRSQNFDLFGKKKFSRNALDLKSKKVQCIFAETFILALSFAAVIRLQTSVSDFF